MRAKSEGPGRDGRVKSMKECQFHFMPVRGSLSDGIRFLVPSLFETEKAFSFKVRCFSHVGSSC